MRSSRTAILTAAFAALTMSAAPNAGATSPDEVLAYGRNVDGICHFDTAYDIPDGMGAHADDTCRLLAVHIAEDDSTVGPAATHMPKMHTYDYYGGSPSGGGGVPGVGAIGNALDAAGTALSLADEIAREARATPNGYRLMHARAYWMYFNELDKMMYHDELNMTYRRSEKSGEISGAMLHDAYCATGGGVFPHRPGVSECKWIPAIYTADTLSVRTGGLYGDTVLLTRVDHRRIDFGFVARSTGSFTPVCNEPDYVPLGWTHTDCRVREVQVN